MNILVVEDERNLADAIVRIASDASYNADAVYDGRSGLRAALGGSYDVEGDFSQDAAFQKVKAAGAETDIFQTKK